MYILVCSTHLFEFRKKKLSLGHLFNFNPQARRRGRLRRAPRLETVAQHTQNIHPKQT